MNSPEPGGDRLAYHIGSLNLSGLTMTKVILWLLAITIVSLVIGFGILALSGELSSSPGDKASPFRQTAPFSPNTTTVPLDGAAAAGIRISLGAGEAAIGGNAPAGALVETTVYSRAPEWQPEIQSSFNGTAKTVTIIENRNGHREWFTSHSPNSWAIRISETVPVELNVEVGAGENTLRLGSLNLTTLTVSSGAGDTEIDITRYHGGPFRAEIHNGVGDLTLRIDKNSNTRIRLHQGVGDVTATGIVQTDETYMTAGFNPALPVHEIAITQGVGSIQLEAE